MKGFMTALEIFIDLLDDPKENGDYVLNIKGEQLRRLWNALQEEDKGKSRYVRTEGLHQ